MKKIIATISAAVLTLGLGAASASADDGARKGWDRKSPAKFAPKCATPYELSRVHLGDNRRTVKRKITAKWHRSNTFRSVMVPRLCRYRVADRKAAAFIQFRKRRVVAVWAAGGSFRAVRTLIR